MVYYKTLISKNRFCSGSKASLRSPDPVRNNPPKADALPSAKISNGAKGDLSLKGFTLIELVMVMVIMAILAALAVPKFDSYYKIKLGGVARRLVSDIRYTQRLAIAKHEDYGIEFNTGSENYRVYRVSDDSTAVDPLSRGNFIMDYTADSEYKDINLASANFEGTNKVRFTSLGVPQDADGNNLITAGTVTISYKGSSETIEVTPNTGKVNLQ